MTDKITDKTLGEAAMNPDGTYNGYRAIEWLFAAVTGKELQPGESADIIQKAQKMAADRKKTK